MNWPHPTIRLRLTLLYGGLFIAASALLLALSYGLLGQSLQPLDRPDSNQEDDHSGDQEGEHQGTFEEQLFEARNEERAGALSAVLTQSLVALVVTSAGAIGLGWVVAGRVLQPIRQITVHARHASEATLGERIGLEGPRDELKELGDTIDGMLGRLEAAFAAQRRFAAQASHELRTPLAVMRAEADVALTAADATERERRLGAAIRTAVDRSERLVDGLLALSRSESTLRESARLDLAELVGDVVGDQARAADAAGLSLDLALETATVMGDRMLLDRLVGNLVENAIRYTPRGGWVRVAVATEAGSAVLRVANSGPVLAPQVIADLFEPFQRGRSDRTGRTRGFGLGLAIVRSVATAHDGEVAATSPAEGGLVVTVRLPAADTPLSTSA